MVPVATDVTVEPRKRKQLSRTFTRFYASLLATSIVNIGALEIESILSLQLAVAVNYTFRDDCRLHTEVRRKSTFSFFPMFLYTSLY